MTQDIWLPKFKCPIEFDNGGGDTIRCGKPAVADCAPDGEKALVILSTAPRLIPVPRCCCICWYCSAGPLAIFWNDLAVAAALDLPDPVTRNSAAAFLANFGSEVCTFWTPDQPFRWEQGP
jgi:hypothetical protein